MLLRFDNFGGLNLVKGPKKGPSWAALKALNVDVREGAIDVAYGLNTAAAVNLTGAVGRRVIYNISGSTFLEFSQDVDIAASPLADNTTKRFYYSDSLGPPKVSNLSMAIAGAAPYPAVSYILGMTIGPKIGYALNVGGAPTENRAYTYTFVSPWGEEGPPAEPLEVLSGVGASVTLKKVGVTTRRYSSAPLTPVGIGAGVTFIGAPTPGFMRFDLTDAGYNNDFRVGDRFYYYTIDAQLARYHSFIVSAVSNAGNGTLDVAANCWGPAGAAPTIWRVLPVNRYNIIGAVKDTPAVGKVTVSVDTTEGLRVNEGVVITGVTGMTDLNATFPAVESIGTDPEHPSFVVPLATAQAYAAGGLATRTARHNTGEVKVTGIAFAAGVATLTLESTAEIAVDQDVLIMGVQGAYQINGKRRVVSVTAPATITIAIAALGAYTAGGVLILAKPDDFEEYPISGIASAGGGPYPTAFLMDITLTRAHSFKVGDLVIGQDIGGAVEANTVMTCNGGAANVVQTTMASAFTAYTAGGKLVRVSSQLHKRIYRTVTGSAGAEFELVDEVSGDLALYTDSIAATALGDVIESTEWIQPPTDLRAMVLHPHGFLMGISKNTVCRSEPFSPHAWPVKNQTVLPADGLSMAVFGVNALVSTTGPAVLLTGVTPENMTRTLIDGSEPNTGKRVNAATDQGVIYRGQSGLHLVGYQGRKNVTEDLLPKYSFLEPVLMLQATMAGSGSNEWLYQRISDAGARVIAAGDYLEYDVYCDPASPAPINADSPGGAELDFSDLTSGRQYVLVDQNGHLISGGTSAGLDAACRGKWYSRQISLTAVLGKTITWVDLTQECNGGGRYRVFYRNIRITDGAGTVRLVIWNGGVPAVNAINYQNGASDVTCQSFPSTSGSNAVFWNNRFIWHYNPTRFGYMLEIARGELTEWAVDFDIYDMRVAIDGTLWASYVDAGQAKRAPLFQTSGIPAKGVYWTQHGQVPKPVCMGALQLDFDWAPQSATMKDREAAIVRNLRRRAGRYAALNDHSINSVAINGDELETIYTPASASATVPTERFLKVTVVANPDDADKQAVIFSDYVVNDDPIRMANGIKADTFQVRCEGNLKVSAVTIAETIEELERA